MLRCFALAILAAGFAWPASGAQPLIENGGFEMTRGVAGAASGDIGFGVWRLAEDRLAPGGWVLNSAYTGELAVLSEGPHSGTHCLRIMGSNPTRPAHVYQPCKGLQPGKWYKVSAWVRGGRISICFYEYYNDGPIRAPTVCVGVAGQGQWRQVSGYYTPGGKGFRSASLALTVARGQRADVDDVRVEELPAVEVPSGDPIVIENEVARMTWSSTARLRGLVCKATGTDYAAHDAPIPVLSAVVDGSTVPAQFIRRRGESLEVQFADTRAKAWIRVVPRKRYFRLDVQRVEPSDMERLVVEIPVRKLGTQGWAFCANYGRVFGTCAFSLGLGTTCSLRGLGESAVVLRSQVGASGGILGGKVGLVACPRSTFELAIQEVERDAGLPCPVLDGKWVRQSEPIRRSYLFATRMHEDDTAALIEYAKIGHFQTILILKNSWLRTHGHFEINTDNFPEGRKSLKRVADAIHAAGLKVGVHVFGPSVSPNDGYVTPVPDERLLTVPCPPLAEPIDSKSAVLTLTAQPDTLPPKRSRNRGFPGYYLRIGDEIVRYATVDTGPPFRFTGCRRGACGTTATAHAKGAKVRGMLSMWGFFMFDPDSTLLDEVTSHFADVVNECGLDMVYFDASDSSSSDYLDARYYQDKCHLAYYRKFDHDVLYQTSTGTGQGLRWHIVARSASADGHGDIKWYLDQRLHSILGMRRNLVFADVGWYGLDQGSRVDRLEYVCGKCLGVDGSISVQANVGILETHPHAREIMEMLGRYERCRLANYFPDSVETQLLEKGKEFKLFEDGEGQWSLWHAAYEPDRGITRLDGKENVWTVQHDRAAPCRVAVELTRGADHAADPDYDRPEAVLLEDFEDLNPYGMSDRNRYERYVVGAGKTLTDHGPVRHGVTQGLSQSTEDARVGRACGVYSATNAAVEPGWGGIGKRFAKPVDLSRCRGVAMWVHGDGANAVLILQFRDTAGRWHNCREKIGFKGWRLLSFKFASNRSIDWSKIDYMIFYYNNIPGKGAVTCKIDDVKALPEFVTAAKLINLALTVNGKRVRLPGELAKGETLTTDGQGGCTIWPGGMKPGRRVHAAATAFTLNPGRNQVKLTCDVPEGLRPDLNVRMIRLWPVTP